MPVYDAGEADGRLFIAMRYVDGADLKAVLRRRAGRSSPRAAVAVAGQVAEALDAAHRRGLVHRDVKPSNVLLDQQGDREHAYLADFGLTHSAPGGRRPTDGQFMGTVDYVAPEQIRGDEVDGRADQYALGCLLFECLTGSLPFRQSSEVATIFAHLEEPPPARERAPRWAAPGDRSRARPRDGEGPGASASPVPRDGRGGARRRSASAARRAGARAGSSRRLVAALAAAAVALGARLGAGRRRRGRRAGGALVRIDPRTDRGRRAHLRPRLSAAGRRDARRGLDGRLPPGRPVAL